MKAPFLEFQEQFKDPKKKTRVWDVRSTVDGKWIAAVQWHSPWRCYVAEITPSTGMIFDAKCLEELRRFVQDATDEQRATWKSGQ